MKFLYSYDGPVIELDRCVKDRWQASTFAKSEKQARNNLAYRYKMAHGKTANTKISLPGKIMVS